jgi:acetyltransferase-like isoleucine patch superfamily enzyme
VWLAHKFPFPFLDNICFKMFGVKTVFSNSLFEGWVDTEMIEFGKNVVVGQATVIQSACVIGNLFIMRKTIIEDNVKIGAHSVIMPGTIIRKDTILAASSMTTVSQELEEGWIYIGAPAKKYKKNVFLEDDIEDKVLSQEKIDKELYEKYEKLYTKRYDKEFIVK